MACGVHATMKDTQDKNTFCRLLVVDSVRSGLIATQAAPYKGIVCTKAGVCCGGLNFRQEGRRITLGMGSAEVFDTKQKDVDQITFSLSGELNSRQSTNPFPAPLFGQLEVLQAMFVR